MFKWLLENSLANRLLVLIAGVVLMAYGAFTLSRTPVDVFPDLNKPTVTIMTEAGGMAAEEVEQLKGFVALKKAAEREGYSVTLEPCDGQIDVCLRPRK
mgnify:CR=1 FL=1